MEPSNELITKKLERINEVHRMDPARTALIVSDMQISFMHPDASLAVPQAWDIVPGIQKLLDFCRKSGVMVVFTEYIASPEVQCLRVDPFGPEHMPAVPGEPTGWGRPSSNSIPGTKGPENPDTIEELKPLPGELVVKGYTLDKFYGTHLDLALRGRDIRYLMITGMMARSVPGRNAVQRRDARLSGDRRNRLYYDNLAECAGSHVRYFRTKIGKADEMR